MSNLTTSTNMKLNATDPDKASNLGLVNWYYIRPRQLSGALRIILENHVSRKSYKSFQPKNIKFIYTYDRSGWKITWSLILFMVALQVMNTQLFIYHQSKERNMEDLTIESCENNVCTYLTKMQEMQNEINSLRKYGINYNNQKFFTLIFNELGKTSGNFLVNVKRQCSKSVKNVSSFNTSTFIAEMINLYTDYKSTGKWDKQGADNNKVLVDLATYLI